MDNHPAISVVVAVYNREDTLDRCIDSLIYQTFEDLEVILVDDQSTDGSMDVMRKWQTLFPERIRIFENPQKGVAHTKNFGVQMARGEYIAFVDSDDYVDYKLFQRLFDCIGESTCKMVYSSIWKKQGTVVTKIGSLLPVCKYPQIETILSSNCWYLHGKLFHRSLFEQFGAIPILRQAEDMVWLYNVVSYLHTEDIVYTDYAGYYYELSANSVCRDIHNADIARDIVLGTDILLERVNPDYLNYALKYAIFRLMNMHKARPCFRELFQDYMRNLPNRYDCSEVFEASPGIVSFLENMPDSSDAQQYVYLNGFGSPKDERSLEQTVLIKPHTVVILNEQNCDISCNKIVENAYKAGNYEFVGHYFAVQRCFEEGGIYLGNDIQIDVPLDSFTFDQCFFGFEDDTHFSDRIFGSRAGSDCMGYLLSTYDMPDLYEDAYTPLQDRIKTVVLGMTNAYMGSSEYRNPQYGIALYPVETLVYNDGNASSPSFAHYTLQAWSRFQENAAPMPVVNAVIERRNRADKERLSREHKREIERLKQVEALSRKRSQYIAKLEKEHEAMLNSWSWKMTKPVRLAGKAARRIRKMLLRG